MDNKNNFNISDEKVDELIKLLREFTSSNKEHIPEVGDAVRPLTKLCDPKGLRVVRGNDVDMERLETGDPNVKCYYRSLLSVQESPHYMPVMLEIDHSSFDWFCGYSETDYVIEGTLILTIDGRRYTLHPGDVSYIPMRSTVNFASPDHCKAFAVVYPTNWGDYC